MIRLPRPREARQRETTIALINIVFLMLIFFLIAGTVTPPLDREVTLISTVEADAAEPPDALFVTADGTLRARGAETTVERFLTEREAAGGTVKLAADRDLAAIRLIEVVGELRAAGVETVSVVTERADSQP